MISSQQRSRRRTSPRPPARRRGWRVTLLLRVSGWTLITVGAVLGLYVVYSLFFTNLATESAQRDMREIWRRDVGEVAASPPAGGDAPPVGEDSDEPPAVVDPGEALAVLQFHRPGSQDAPVHAEPLFVIEGVTREALTKGPGHYPDSQLPGRVGNFAVAGHRTTFGAPFFHLDAIRPGDEIHVTDRSGRRYVYEVVEQRLVGPRDIWVIGPDPLETGGRTLTLTTCHPRFSARERLVVFAKIMEPAI